MKRPIVQLTLLAALIAGHAGCAQQVGGADDEGLDPLDGDDTALDLGKEDAGPRLLPKFQAMWDAYPMGEAEEVKMLIGGAVNADWVTNTCTIRISRALNYSDFKIPSTVAGLNTLRGADNKRYAYRVAEFRRYIRAKLGAPTISQALDPTTGAIDRTPFAGKKGIIMFEVHGWSDASGHFDLWDGTKPAHAEYFDKASLVQLWLAPADS